MDTSNLVSLPVRKIEIWGAHTKHLLNAVYVPTYPRPVVVLLPLVGGPYVCSPVSSVGDRLGC